MEEIFSPPTKARCAACDGNYGKACPTCKPKSYGIGILLAAMQRALVNTKYAYELAPGSYTYTAYTACMHGRALVAATVQCMKEREGEHEKGSSV